MSLSNIKSGDEYADILIKDLQRVQDMSNGDGLHPTIFKAWCKRIRTLCRENYRAFKKGNKEDYKLSDTEIGDAYDQAVSDYTDTLLEGLMDKGLIEMAVSEEGGIVYGLSEKGKSYANLMKDIMGEDEEDEEDDFEN